LPIALARMLQQHGHDESKHVAELRMMETADRDIWTDPSYSRGANLI